MSKQPDSILKVLEAVDQKFDSADKWTKGHYARDAEGNRCPENVGSCHCIVGCVIAVSPSKSFSGIASDVGRATINYLASMVREGDSCKLTEWNDAPSRTFQDIKELLHQAKSRLSK